MQNQKLYFDITNKIIEALADQVEKAHEASNFNEKNPTGYKSYFDLSDIGNTIGIAIAKTMENISELPDGYKQRDFFAGLNHGFELVHNEK